MEKKLVIHLVNYANGITDPFAYYADAIMFDNDHIGLTVRIMPNGYELCISTLEYTNDNHTRFKELFIKPLLDNKGFIKGTNFGNEHYAQFENIEIRYVILNEFNKK